MDWPNSIDGPHLWTIFDFGYRGEYRLFLNIELALSGLALLGVLVWRGISPGWATLLLPRFQVSLILIAALSALLVGAIWALPPETRLHQFRPLDPFAHPEAWSISLASLALGAFQQEIWGRAILQTCLKRMFGNRWVALGVAGVLLAAAQPGHRVEAFCTSVLLGVVFIRTHSVVCTTALHFVLKLGLGVLQGGTFMVASYLEPREFWAVLAWTCLGLLLLAVAVELWHRRSPRLIQSIRTFAKDLLVIALVYGLYQVTSRWGAPLWDALMGANEWMTPMLVTQMDLLVRAAVPLIALAWWARAPSLREILALHSKTTVSLMALGACLPVLAAAIAIPEAFRPGHFSPINPLNAGASYWLGAVLPLAVAALHEEVFHRALVQSLLGRLLRSQWAAAILSALFFTVFHPFEGAVFVFPGGLLFAIVFMRTRSILCTTLLHVAMNLSVRMVTGTQFTHEVFIPLADYVPAQPLLGVLVLALVVGFECCWRVTVKAKTRQIGIAEMPASTRQIADGC